MSVKKPKKEIKQPMLFEVEIEDKEEKKAANFLYRLNQKGFIEINDVYLKNYINADLTIAFSHIKTSYKQYVSEGKWDEEKFEDILLVIAKRRNMLIPAVFLKLGTQYDDGKLTKEIEFEKRKYKEKEEVNTDEEELLAYIAKHGGR